MPHPLEKVREGREIHCPREVGLSWCPGNSREFVSRDWPVFGGLRGRGRCKKTAGGHRGRGPSPGDRRALSQPLNAPAVGAPGLDTQRDPGGGVTSASGPATTSRPAPAPAAGCGVGRAGRAIAVDAEKATGSVRKAEAAHARPAPAATRARIHDGVARTPVGQPACGAAVQQLQLPGGEQLPHLGHGRTARCAGARCSREGQGPQRLQEEHTPCGGWGDKSGTLPGPGLLEILDTSPPAYSPGPQPQDSRAPRSLQLGPQPLPRHG